MKKYIILTTIFCILSSYAYGEIENFVVTAQSHQQIDLSWNSVAGASKYWIYRSTDPSFTPSEENKIAETEALFYKDMALRADTSYTYLVSARRNDDSEIDVSSKKSATTKSADITAYEYDTDSNRLIKMGKTSYFYDRAGNITKSENKTSWTKFSYNAANQLERVESNDGLFEEYLYDAFGRRVIKKSNGETRIKYFNSFVRYESSNGYTVSYQALGMTFAIRTPSGEIHYRHHDHLGSMISATNSAEETSQKVEYYPFGGIKSRGNSDEIDEPRLFTGQTYDRDTKLYNFPARYYDSNMCRFIQPDTLIPDITDSQSLNSYSYTKNDPVNRTDPSGHCDDGTICLDYDPSFSYYTYNYFFYDSFALESWIPVPLYAGSPLNNYNTLNYDVSYDSVIQQDDTYRLPEEIIAEVGMFAILDKLRAIDIDNAYYNSPLFYSFDKWVREYGKDGNPGLAGIGPTVPGNSVAKSIQIPLVMALSGGTAPAYPIVAKAVKNLNTLNSLMKDLEKLENIDITTAEGRATAYMLALKYAVKYIFNKDANTTIPDKLAHKVFNKAVDNATKELLDNQKDGFTARGSNYLDVSLPPLIFDSPKIISFKDLLSPGYTLVMFKGHIAVVYWDPYNIKATLVGVSVTHYLVTAP